MLKKILVVVVCFVLVPFSSKAQQPSVSAKAAVVIDAATENIVYSKNHNIKLPMASTTKIMTAICAIENSNTNIPVPVSDTAVGTEGSSIYLAKGEVITLKELLYGLMLNSGNDAAVAIAVAVSGTVEEFCKLMNRTAQSVGAVSTNFTNPSGLYDDNHYTTAYDLALITAYAMKNPLFKEIVSTKEQKISSPAGSRYLKNHNKLLWMYDGCVGVKTGYTKKCGRCLVSAAQKDGICLIAVTLNAPDDWRDHTSMLSYGFSRSVTETIAREGEYATSLYAENTHIPLSFDNKMVVNYIKPQSLTMEYTFDTDVTLPVQAGKTLGRAKLLYKGKVVSSSDLISQKSIPLSKENSYSKVLLNTLKDFIS